MTVITPTASERAAGKLDAANLTTAVRALLDDGIVVLEGVVDLGHIETLRERSFSDLARFQARPDAPYNWNKGNIQQDPPPFMPYLFRDVLVNDYAIQVTKEVLGKGMRNAFYSGNTALPSEERQPVHADIGHLWPNQEHVHPPYGIVVNVPLVDMGPENGSTEIWPGTHKDPSVTIQDGQIEASEAAMAKWRAVKPPFQPVVKAGSIVIRDIRMWHAGMPNRTQTPRPMIAMIHYVSWWPLGDKMKFGKGAEAVLQHPDLETWAEFVDGEPDYVGSPHGYDGDGK
ncbi:MAG: phytanoyl-CoA dioxygenase family protein [Armatimonadetes bacterium]|nr:phytanoyl-CoA dioxygenase family protein [Armatimonadota bacterium]